jgi:hypothetical protein
MTLAFKGSELIEVCTKNGKFTEYATFPCTFRFRALSGPPKTLRFSVNFPSPGKSEVYTMLTIHLLTDRKNAREAMKAAALKVNERVYKYD